MFDLFFCTDDSGNHGKGTTLKAAYQDYCDEHDQINPDDLVFYEALKVAVEVQFVKKEVVKSIKQAAK